MPLNGACVLMECPGVVPNWVVAGAIGPTQADRHASKVDALRKSDPQIDWSAISERDGDRRRVAKSLLEVLRAQKGNVAEVLKYLECLAQGTDCCEILPTSDGFAIVLASRSGCSEECRE